MSDDEERQNLARLDNAAKLFNALLVHSLPPSHALGRLFCGIMLVYFEDESALEETHRRIAPIIHRCEASNELLVFRVLRSLFILRLAASAAKRGSQS